MMDILDHEVKKKVYDNTIPVLKELAALHGTFVTGSAAVGGFIINDSDINIVVPIEYRDVDIKAIKIRLQSAGYMLAPSDYNDGFKILKQGQSIPVNVITLHPFEYCAWLFATNVLANQETIKDRNARHRAFELACILFKSTNTSGRYVTTEGASQYFFNHKPREILDIVKQVLAIT